MDEFGQPRCPDDGIVMRDTPTAFVCPHCGHRIEIEAVDMPPGFNGPSIHGG